MGSTLVQHGGLGYWDNESTLEILLQLVVDEIKKLSPCTGALSALADLWKGQLRISCVLNMGLDEYLRSDEERGLLKEMVEALSED